MSKPWRNPATFPSGAVGRASRFNRRFQWIRGEDKPLQFLFRNSGVLRILVGSYEIFESLNRAIGQARVKPVLESMFPFHKVSGGYHYLQAVGMEKGRNHH